MTSPNKPTSKPSKVAKMSVKLIWRKKPNLCNTSNVLNTTSLIPKSLTPHHEPSQENNHHNQALPNPYIKDTPTSPQVVSHPPLPISPINSHIAHTQAPPQSNNQTQHIPPLSPNRESLVDDINQLLDLSILLAMHLTQQQNNIPSLPYSLNLPHTLNINHVETHVGTAGASMPVSTAGMVQQVNIIIPSSSETTKDKGKAIMQESEQPKKIKKRVQIQMSLDEELAQKLHEEEQARFNAEQEAKFNAEQEELLASETTEDEANPPVADIDWDDVQAQIQADEDLAQKLLEEERENLSIEERARLLAELIDKRKKLQAA
ncbi:hypothetical protein Tco_1532931 [Tanacetum coccineum]